MRLYTFTNWMLRPIQQGIQPLHVLGDMVAKYTAPSIEKTTLLEWCRTHKTVICLDGGTAGNVKRTAFRLAELGDQLSLPHAAFHEDEESLDGAMTSCGIVVPANIYEDAFASAKAKMQIPPLDVSWTPEFTPEEQLACLVRQAQLAR